MLSSFSKKGAEQTLTALQLGAVDFICTPSGQISLDIEQISEVIVQKILAVASASNKLNNFTISLQSKGNAINKFKNNKVLNNLVLIGTSTGGPKALYQVIPRLPADIDAAVLVVQHMPAGFTKSLAESLDSIAAVHVKEGEHGEKVCSGCVYIAPGDYHMTLDAREKQVGEKELYITLDKNPPRGGLRPAVDVLLESAAEKFWSHMVGVIMTGIGHDGAAGVLKVKAKGARIIAEHPCTCIVYGMPKAAVETGAVDKLVPLPDIPREIIKMLN
jgi:two-component system chemotaxis response regulator CheB